VELGFSSRNTSLGDSSVYCFLLPERKMSMIILLFLVIVVSWAVLTLDERR
jgi:hypothetical protein